ncbi:MAG: MoaD/ThiS family protein [Chloroflexi bacterium]|nr:MoaD/ThiS family protein [Chloroflexota bacterium]
MQVRLNSTIRGTMGRRAVLVELEGETDVRSVLEGAAEQVPALGELIYTADGDLQPNLVVFLNGRKIIMLQGLDTPVKPDDTLDLFPKTGLQRAFAHVASAGGE